MTPYFLLLVVYSLLLIAIGWWTSRRVRDAGDFFVAGRRLSPGLLFATLLAANIGAGSTVGATGLGYKYGLSAWWWVGSAGIGSLILGLTVGPKLWDVAARMGFYTVGDYLEYRYNRHVRGLIAVLLWIGTLAILAGQFIAVAWVLNTVLGVPRFAGCLLGGLVVVVYFTFGGLLASAHVNVVQLVIKFSGFLMTFGFIFGVHRMLFYVNPLEPIGSIPGESGFQAFFGDDPGRVLGYIVLLVPSFIISPGLLQKIYGASSASAVRAGVCANALALMGFALIPAILGMAARTEFPNLSSRELALPTLLTQSLPVWLGGLTLAAVFSAEISSADAILFMLSTSLSKDLYQAFINPQASEQKLLWVGRATSVVAGLFGVLFAILLPTVIDALSIFYSILSVALFVPLIAGLYFRRPDAVCAYVTISGSIATMIAVHIATDGQGLWGGTPTIWGIGAAAVLMMGCVGIRGRRKDR